MPSPELPVHAYPVDLDTPSQQTVSRKISPPRFIGTGPMVGSFHAPGHYALSGRESYITCP